MNNVYNRTEELRDRLNKYLVNLTGVEKDYFGELLQDDLIEMKLALSDVNNVLTLKTVKSFLNWLVAYFNLPEPNRAEIFSTIDETKPNSNGFDIEIKGPQNIVAEIKCIVPINRGIYYGAAQRNSILDDANKLLEGKKSIPDTTEFIKMLGLIDLGEKTNEAIIKLMTPAKNIRTNQTIRLKRHEVVGKLKLIEEDTQPEHLSKEFVYIKKISIN